MCKCTERKDAAPSSFLDSFRLILPKLALQLQNEQLWLLAPRGPRHRGNLFSFTSGRSDQISSVGWSHWHKERWTMCLSFLPFYKISGLCQPAAQLSVLVFQPLCIKSFNEFKPSWKMSCASVVIITGVLFVWPFVLLGNMKEEEVMTYCCPPWSHCFLVPVQQLMNTLH